MDIVQYATNTAILDDEIAALSTDLAALQDMARSLPVGMIMPFDKRSIFAELEDKVNQQFERISYALAAVEGDMLD